MLAPQGRVIMVTGANRGIGLAITKNLYEKGYTLSLGARNRDSLDHIVTDMDSSRVMTHAHDATVPATNEDWVAATINRFSRIDGLVNNAGTGGKVNLEDDDDKIFDAIWAINTKGPMRMIRLAMPHLRASGTGRIINIVSLSGKRVTNDGTGYAMSKFALMAVSHAARRAAWADGVRVTAVCPGWVRTDMTDGNTDVPHDEKIQPGDLAEIVAMAISLPNTAAVAEILVNCTLGDMF